MSRDTEAKGEVRGIRNVLKKRSFLRFVALGSIACVAILLTTRFLGSKEPAYQGRSLRSWMMDFDYTPWQTNTPVARAIRAMGTNSIPYLVEDILGRDPKWREEARRHLWTTRPSLYWLRKSPAQRARTRASHALRALGPDASPALPLLIEELQATRGQPGLPWVGILVIAPNISNAVPRVLGELDGPEYRLHMARFLKANPMSPDLAIPYLIDCLGDEDGAVRRYALLALQEYGADAATAIPHVELLLGATNAALAGQASATLDRIRSEDSGK